MKKPWYIWLSVPAFAFLWGDTARRIWCIKNKNLHKSSAMDIWIEALINMFKITICYLMFPTGLFILAIELAGNHSYLLRGIVNCIAIVLLYLLGVYATHKHILWREKYISYMLR